MAQLKTRLQKVDQTFSSEEILFRGDKFFKVLKEFAMALQDLNPGVYAEAERGDIPQVFYLKVAPQHRPFESNIMMNFFMGEDGLATSSKVIKTVTELEEHLVDFYALPAFRESLASMAERSKEDIYGLLRRSLTDLRMDTAALFLLPNSEFIRLATARQHTTLTLRVHKESRYYGGTLTNPADMLTHLQAFRWFAVSGYGLRVTHVRPSKEDDWYEIEGETQPYGKVR